MVPDVANDRRTLAGANYRRLLAQRMAAVDALAASGGPNSATRKQLDADYAAAEGNLKAVEDELNNRPVHIRFENPWLFWIPAILVFVLEAFINKIVIDMAAQTPSAVSLAIAGGLSLALVWMAHNAGVCWRQIWSDFDHKIVWSSLIWGVVLVAIVVVVVLVLMTLRAYFVLIDTSADLNIFDTAAAITALGMGFVRRALVVPEALTIGGLNVLMLLFAFLFAFFSHDSDKVYDRRYREKKAARKKLGQSIKVYEAKLEQVNRRSERSIGRALRTYVANGGNPDDLPANNFRQQRFEAEQAIMRPEPEGPLREPEQASPPVGPERAGSEPPPRKGEGPRLVTPVAKAAGAPNNPW